MTDEVTSVGRAIATALDRAEQLRRLPDRPARVRIMTVFGDDRSGLTINASIAARSPAELRAQEGLGTRCIPWAELDARAGEIVGLVDEVVREVTLAVRDAPATQRPSHSETDVDIEGFDELVDELRVTLTGVAMAVLESRRKTNSLSPPLGSEATMLAALKLAAFAACTANVGLSDAQDELRNAITDVQRKAGPGEYMQRPVLNS